MPLAPLAFISYRRTDTSQAAQGLYVQLRAKFGPARVFMDVSTTKVGDAWPDRLRRSLEKSTVLMVVMGPNWLTAADEYGRRRLDLPDDWVRTEIVHAISDGIPIMPILVGASTGLPAAEGLPSELVRLLDFSGLRMREERWDADFSELVETLVKSHRFIPGDRPVVLPQPRVTIQPLSEHDLETALVALPGWEPVETMVPGDYPNARQELRKAFRFRSFARAVEFMQTAVAVIERLQHHPRWENQWRTVTIYLSTWDIGNRITALDTELARALDHLYEQTDVRTRGSRHTKRVRSRTRKSN
jgi:pterin-4a-carbinolamine dehydratase